MRLLECLEERIEFINQLFSLSSKMLERDLRQDEFHGGRVYINIYIHVWSRSVSTIENAENVGEWKEARRLGARWD